MKMEPFEREDDKSKLLPEPPVEQESDCSDKTIRIIFALFEDCQQEETFVALTLYSPGVQSARISFFLRLLFFFSRKHAIKLFTFH